MMAKRQNTHSEDEFSADFTFFIEESKAPASSNETNGEDISILDSVIQKKLGLLTSLTEGRSNFENKGSENRGKNSTDDDWNERVDDFGGLSNDRPDDQIEEAHTATTAPPRSFAEFQLSRPLMKAVAQLGFFQPTPIQVAAIPLILTGRDLFGCAVTGSGKTAAFAIPTIERLLQSKVFSGIRVLVILPTRELAAQCAQVWQSLIHFTKLELVLLAGGLSLSEQEAKLKKSPDIIIATPGRLVDLLLNSTLLLESVEVLILDEADRMLEDGFTDELNFIIKSAPRHRQTLLFSATLSSSAALDGLARLSLVRPLRVQVDSSEALASKLTQEFIRVRQSPEEDARNALLLSSLETLLKDSANYGIIIFFPTKLLTHRARILLGLRGLPAALYELHGDLSQPQRMATIEKFKHALKEPKENSKLCSILLCTDVAARGLDIPGLAVAINWSLPPDYIKYQHRIGRTARAGRSGRSISFVGENDRQVLKQAIKNGDPALISQSSIPLAELAPIMSWIASVQVQVAEVIEEERELKSIAIAERTLKKSDNLVQFAKEIYSRPKRTFLPRPKRANLEHKA